MDLLPLRGVLKMKSFAGGRRGDVILRDERCH
jgi:hypothetical protein